MVAAHCTLPPRTDVRSEKPRLLTSQLVTRSAQPFAVWLLVDAGMPLQSDVGQQPRQGTPRHASERPLLRAELGLRILRLVPESGGEGVDRRPLETEPTPRVAHPLRACPVRRLLAQLNETEAAFDEFWAKHQQKLQQCLQLRHFEQNFREVSGQSRGSWRWAPGAPAAGSRRGGPDPPAAAGQAAQVTVAVGGLCPPHGAARWDRTLKCVAGEPLPQQVPLSAAGVRSLWVSPGAACVLPHPACTCPAPAVCLARGPGHTDLSDRPLDAAAQRSRK